MLEEPTLERAITACIMQLSQDNLRKAHKLVAEHSNADGVLLRFLVKAVHERDWDAVQSVVACAFGRPSDRLADALGALLADTNPNLNNEDIADLLGEIASPSSVDALAKAVQTDYPMDEEHDVNKKAVLALGRIGTPNAIMAIKQAAASHVEAIREEAEAQLDWIGQRDQ